MVVPYEPSSTTCGVKWLTLARDALRTANETNVRPFQQQIAFDALCDAMRKSGGTLSLLDLRKLSLAKLNVVAPDWTTPRRLQVADIVARSVASNFKLRKATPLPQDPRAAKTRRTAEILQYYGLSPEPKPSVRNVAKKFGISVATAHAILAKVELKKGAKKPNTLSQTARELVDLLDDQLPTRSCRLVDFKHVQWALNRDEDEILQAFGELAAARQPLTVLDTGISTGREYNSKWLVVQRGKNKKPDELLAWGRNRALGMNTDTRSRVDQRIVIRIDHEPALPSNPVLRDVGAILLMSQGSESLRTWRAFIDASSIVNSAQFVIPSGAIVIGDPGAILNAVNGASRRLVLDDRLRQMSYWISDSDDAVGAKALFEIAFDLRSSTQHSPLELILNWAAVTRYRERVMAGLLPGRSLDDFEMLTTYAEIADLNKLYELFLACPSNCVPPPYFVEHPLHPTPINGEEVYEAENGEDIFEDGDHDENDDGYIFPVVEDE